MRLGKQLTVRARRFESSKPLKKIIINYFLTMLQLFPLALIRSNLYS